MGVLDYIYRNQDGALPYYDHAGCSVQKAAIETGKTIMEGAPFCDFCFSMEEDCI